MCIWSTRFQRISNTRLKRYLFDDKDCLCLLKTCKTHTGLTPRNEYILYYSHPEWSTSAIENLDRLDNINKIVEFVHRWRCPISPKWVRPISGFSNNFSPWTTSSFAPQFTPVALAGLWNGPLAWFTIVSFISLRISQTSPVRDKLGLHSYDENESEPEWVRDITIIPKIEAVFCKM